MRHLRLLGRPDPGARAAGDGVPRRATVRVQARSYADAVAARAAGPPIAELRRAVEELCRRELHRSARDVEPEVLNRAAHAITGKLMHRPTLSARAAATTGDLAALRLICKIFDAPAPVVRSGRVTPS